ncbi:NIPSNAP family protein [Pseudoroseomonas wenyumeiae]|uniref:NIPSNAP family protein n=1 Tax=Teichococcus wenyumeiae TaxID=2478470 RepID=A0A3A9JRG8_9PROT|nr:NIPSNAP family protein [Pseudoroseomonas wenyumeiae]RKK03268.1 NIPSNAP family protein [Pseudoroseomonas wenyumeiae]RMI16957.1 NIPSNAP family protein [Pseudoroseomonas wenyumeiae]
MIVEERIYTLQAGQAPSYLAAYEAEGLAIQKPILGRMVGYYATEFGPLNQVIHLWAYEDLAERAQRRARLLADPEWKVYAAKVRPMVVRQENKLLLPAPFMKVLWQAPEEPAGP